MSNLAEEYDAGRHVRATLLFAASDGTAPEVIVPKSGDDAPSRSGLDEQEVLIADGRIRAGAFSLNREGFQFLKRPSLVTNFEDDAEVQQVYYPEIRELVAGAVGATEVEVFDHTIPCHRPGNVVSAPRQPCTQRLHG